MEGSAIRSRLRSGIDWAGAKETGERNVIAGESV